MLSKNYLVVLTKGEKGTMLLLFNLHAIGLTRETEFLVKPDTVAFTQAASHCTEMHTLDVFQITLLTAKGDLFSLCPVLLQEMALQDDHFS